METAPQSWKRRGNGRETNGKCGDRGADVAAQALAAEQLASAVTKVGGSDDAFVAIDAQAREGIKEA